MPTPNHILCHWTGLRPPTFKCTVRPPPSRKSGPLPPNSHLVDTNTYTNQPLPLPSPAKRSRQAQPLKHTLGTCAPHSTPHSALTLASCSCLLNRISSPSTVMSASSSRISSRMDVSFSSISASSSGPGGQRRRRTRAIGCNLMLLVVCVVHPTIECEPQGP